jgi:hypothetical protein
VAAGKGRRKRAARKRARKPGPRPPKSKAFKSYNEHGAFPRPWNGLPTNVTPNMYRRSHSAGNMMSNMLSRVPGRGRKAADPARNRRSIKPRRKSRRDRKGRFR